MNKLLKSVFLIIMVSLMVVCFVSLPSCKSDKGKKAPPSPAGQPAAKTTPSGTSTATATTSTKPAAPTKPAEAVPKKKEEVYAYNMIRTDGQPKRDPFTPIKMVGIETPAQSFDVSQLGVNGVIIHGVKKANVVTPDCASLEVKVGDGIGIHDGTIVDITLDGVKVRETYVDIRGQIQEYERVIKNQPYSSCK
jgi:Tfp pilus assembly protein PilP